MIEELLEIAKDDNRVECDFVINDKIHLFKAIGDIKNKDVIYFCDNKYVTYYSYIGSIKVNNPYYIKRVWS